MIAPRRLGTAKYSPITVLLLLPLLWIMAPLTTKIQDFKSFALRRTGLFPKAFTEGGAPLSLPRFAMICCGPRTDEILVLLKTLLLFSQDENVEVFIIADEVAQPLIGAGVESLIRSSSLGSRSRGFNVTIVPYEVPPGTEDWVERKQWLCTRTKLFLHKILADIDAVLHLDTDHVVLSSVMEIWQYFENQQRLNPFAVMSMTDHVPAPAKSQYNYRDIPFFGNSGVNGGTMFLNLTRMRQFQFDRLVFETYDQYRGKGLGGGLDQDIINIIFATHPHNASIMECNYGLRLEHCGIIDHKCLHDTPEAGSVCFCWPALLDGVRMIHATGKSFHSDGDWDVPFFRSIFRAFEQTPLNSAAVLDAIQILKDEFTKSDYQPPCFGLTAEAVYRNAEKYLRAKL